jgi:hypothetical protein
MDRSMARRVTRAAAPSPAAPDQEAATYVYCVVHGARAPSMRGVPPGVPSSAPPRRLPVDRSLAAIVSSVPIGAYGEAALDRGLKDLTWVSECAVGHERVVERFLDRGTVVPMKLFTIFRNDARALEHLATEKGAIARLVRRLSGRVEFGVRVSLTGGRVPAAPTRAPASGAQYLQAKRRARDAALELSARAQDRVEEIFERLAAVSSESLRRPVIDTNAGDGRVLLDAAYLVPTRRIPAFQSMLRALARSSAADGYNVVVTGPWPAYNFVGDPR